VQGDHKVPRLLLITLAPFVLSCVGGCDTVGRNLFIAHNTVVGVDAAVNTDQTQGHIIIGYDRQFVGYIPRSVPDHGAGVATTTPTSERESKKRDAMTAVACSKVAVDGIFLTQFTEYLATGRAAELYAKALRAHPGTQLYNCLDKPANPSE
jgi:hypothetical protein